MNVTMIIQENENGVTETRETNMAHAHNMGKNGGFYKVQIVGEFGEIIAEYK